MSFHRPLALLLVVAGALAAQVPGAKAPAKPEDPAPTRLIQEIGAHSELLRNLEELCDDYGPRLSGSHSLRRAQAWAMAKLKQYGAVNVHEEAYDLGRPWTRGIARARLLNANGQALQIAQLGWTEGTQGVVQGEVVSVDVKTLAELQAAAPRLAGKVVLLLGRPRATAAERADLKAHAAALTQAWREAHPALVLLPSEKEYGLLDMGGSPASPFSSPVAFIVKEHAHLLQRLLLRGITPRVEAELGGQFGDRVVQATNVVAELQGTDTLGEVVIVAAHQDSWDLGTGATDNGAGTVTALEVLRAVRAAGLKPRRTLRIVLFSGEEQGLLGSRAYVAAHAPELPKIQAVLVQDTGAGRILGFPDMKVDAWTAALSAAMAPAQVLGAVDLPYALSGGSDHTSFFERGIPAFSPIQEPLDYRTHTHHSQMDSFDHVAQEDLLQGAQVMAITAWGLLNGDRLPHQVPSATP